jgi:hypothetical protein
MTRTRAHESFPRIACRRFAAKHEEQAADTRVSLLACRAGTSGPNGELTMNAVRGGSNHALAATPVAILAFAGMSAAMLFLARRLSGSGIRADAA